MISIPRIGCETTHAMLGAARYKLDEEHDIGLLYAVTPKLPSGSHILRGRRRMSTGKERGRKGNEASTELKTSFILGSEELDFHNLYRLPRQLDHVLTLLTRRLRALAFSTEMR